MSGVLSARAAAARRGVSDRTIRRWIASGRLKANKAAGEFLIDQEELDALTGQDTAAAAAPRHGPDSAATYDTEGSRLGAASAAAPSIDLSGLLALIERQQAQLLERTEAAAMWQTRALMLEERLALAAPEAAQAKQDANPGPVVPAPTTDAPVPLTARLLPLAPWLLIALIVLAVIAVQVLLVMLW